MESFIRPPDPLKDNNLKTWIIWKEEFLIFMTLLGYMERSQSVKANFFKNLIGTVGLETINKLSFECREDRENLDILLKKLDNYYNPQQTVIQKRYIFFKSTMKSDETIENYLQNLMEKAKDCDFGDMTESLVRDVVILHTNDKVLRGKYLQEENLNAHKITDIYKNHKINMKEAEIKKSNVQSTAENRNKAASRQKESANATSTQRSCWRCKTQHLIRQCPAWNYKCTKCNEMHHFEKCCKNQNSQPQNNQPQYSQPQNSQPQNPFNNSNMNNFNLNNEKHPLQTKMNYKFGKSFE